MNILFKNIKKLLLIILLQSLALNAMAISIEDRIITYIYLDSGLIGLQQTQFSLSTHNGITKIDVWDSNVIRPDLDDLPSDMWVENYEDEIREAIENSKITSRSATKSVKQRNLENAVFAFLLAEGAVKSDDKTVTLSGLLKMYEDWEEDLEDEYEMDMKHLRFDRLMAPLRLMGETEYTITTHD